MRIKGLWLNSTQSESSFFTSFLTCVFFSSFTKVISSPGGALVKVNNIIATSIQQIVLRSLVWLLSPIWEAVLRGGACASGRRSESYCRKDRWYSVPCRNFLLWCQGIPHSPSVNQSMFLSAFLFLHFFDSPLSTSTFHSFKGAKSYPFNGERSVKGIMSFVESVIG